MAEEINTLSSERIALIEKKMNMTLDDLINDSKKEQFTKKVLSSSRRASNKTKRPPLVVADSHGSSSKLRHYVDSRSCFRQEALAQRRLHENQFSATTNAARKSVFHPTRLTAKKETNKPRRSIKWVMGVGYVTPAYNNKIQQSQTELGEVVPMQKLRVLHNAAKREVAVWRQGRDPRFCKFSEEHFER